MCLGRGKGGSKIEIFEVEREESGDVEMDG